MRVFAEVAALRYVPFCQRLQVVSLALLPGFLLCPVVFRLIFAGYGVSVRSGAAILITEAVERKPTISCSPPVFFPRFSANQPAAR
jgi:hypothetical protein